MVTYDYTSTSRVVLSPQNPGQFINNLFTRTLQTMTEEATDQMHDIMAELFQTMDLGTRNDDREKCGVNFWARDFPYVNGNLFFGATDCPKLSKLSVPTCCVPVR
nr:type IIL restriction-modification enzyme MmeI [Acetobacter pasteurianus]